MSDPQPESITNRPPPRALAWGAVLLAALGAAFVLIPAPLTDKFYWIGFGICPQRAAHSYFLGGSLVPGEASLRAALPFLQLLAPTMATKLPVEARMYGMFAGFLLTWVYAFCIGRGRAALMPPKTVMAAYIGMIALMGIDGINATLFDLHNAGVAAPFAYVPRLDVRFVTGWLCGIAMAGLVLPVVNYCLWRDAAPRAMFDTLRELLPLVATGAMLWGLQALGSGLYFYPLAVLAPLGILATLGALNVVLVLTLQQRERVAANWFAALNPLAIAVVLSLVELGVLSFVRWLTFGPGAIG